MATQYTEVYDAFLSKIKDYEFGELESDVVEYDLLKLLKGAVVYFKIPENPYELDDEAKAFSIDFTNEEIQIVATLMKREWFKRLIANTDVLIQNLAKQTSSLNPKHLTSMLSIRRKPKLWIEK